MIFIQHRAHGLGLLFASLALATPFAAAHPSRTPELGRAIERASQMLAGQSAAGGLDRRAPVFKAFGVGMEVNTTRVDAALPIDIAIEDDLSGLAYVYVEARGPTGQTEIVESYPSFPGRKNRLALQMPLTSASQPGLWQVTFAYAYDLAGNYAALGQSDLDTLGNTRFVVRTRPADTAAPILVRGRILTPTVSRSAPAPGLPEGGPTQSVGVGLSLTDAGGRTQAGIRSASANFCHWEPEMGCDGTFAVEFVADNGQRGLTAQEIVLGGRPVPNEHFSGTYYLQDVRVEDFAGNVSSYRSTQFGGETDFSLLFPSTVLVLTP